MKLLTLACIFVNYVLLLYCICHREWQRLAPSPSKAFNYRITDMWAATLGLVPSLLFIAHCLDSSHLPEGILVCAMLVSGQIAGAFCGRLRYLELAETDVAWQSALLVLAGAILGILFIPLYLVCLALLFPAIAAYLLLYLFIPGLARPARPASASGRAH